MDVLRFDAVMEMGAPIVKTHATAFVRYWVSPEAYMASVVWAEPHIGSLNISPYPVSVSIESTPDHFCVASQIHEHITCDHAKPTPRRGPFYHKLNTYALEDMRFAEREASIARIYTADLSLPSTPSGDPWEIINVPVPDLDSHQAGSRDVAKLHMRRSHDQVQSLRLYDPNDQLIKSIDYTWSEHNGQTRLAQQKAILPERPISIGFKGEGLIAENKTNRYAISKMNATHHSGERHCTVRYRSFLLDETLLFVPEEIAVSTRNGTLNLRSAKLFNFTALQMTLQEMRDQANHFGHFTQEEMRCRELFKEYWFAPASSVSEEDKDTLKHLVEHFEQCSVLGKSPGEHLRQINTLFILEMILDNDTAARRHFDEYLSALTSYDLDYMVLLGGASMIDTAIRWQRFALANKMLPRWVNSSKMTNSMDSIEKFVDAVPNNGHLWQTIRLIDSVLPSINGFEDQCSLSVSRALALGRLCKSSSASRKAARDGAQVSWVLYQVKPDGLFRLFDESVKQAQQLLTQQDQDLMTSQTKRWLDRCVKDRDTMPTSRGEE